MRQHGRAAPASAATLVRQETEAAHAFERRILARVREKRLARDASRQQQREDSLTLGQRIADWVAETMGSWGFIIVQSGFLIVWIALNVAGWFNAWDPYPFILLNLMLSFQAAYSAPFIMMSQNRQEARDRERAELDLLTDLKAETLIEELHGNLEDLRLRRWAELLEIQQRQIELLSDLLEKATGGRSPATTGDATGEPKSPGA
ncbi:MAG: DUF1003 domain-containing protein [Chloroflexi bacterium]|nr:DUF1003 domain-containing protein [Chloroflexota bacterium]